jgi:DNA repair protein RadD
MAASDELIKPTQANQKDDTKIEFYNVTHVVYSKHEKKGKAPCLKVTYFSGMQSFIEFVFLESSKPFIKNKAVNWWQQRHPSNIPFNTDEALKLIRELRTPKKIKVKLNGDYPEILSAEW